MDAELRKQPTTDERANDSNDEIADDPKSGALHDLAGQPSGNEADHKYDQKTFTRICIFVSSRFFGRFDKIQALFRKRESYWPGWKRTFTCHAARHDPPAPQGLPPYQ